MSFVGKSFLNFKCRFSQRFFQSSFMASSSGMQSHMFGAIAQLWSAWFKLSGWKKIHAKKAHVLFFTICHYPIVYFFGVFCCFPPAHVKVSFFPAFYQFLNIWKVHRNFDREIILRYFSALTQSYSTVPPKRNMIPMLTAMMRETTMAVWAMPGEGIFIFQMCGVFFAIQEAHLLVWLLTRALFRQPEFCFAKWSNTTIPVPL